MKEYIVMNTKVFRAKVPITQHEIDLLEKTYRVKYVGPVKKTTSTEGEVTLYIFKVIR